MGWNLTAPALRQRRVRYLFGALVALVWMGAAWISAPMPAAAAVGAADDDASSQTLLVGAYVDDWSGDALREMNDKGQPVSIGGLFHAIDENNPFSRVEAQSDRTGWLLERSWQQGATPFSNLHIEGTSADIAAGYHDGELLEWLGHVQRWLDRNEGRRLTVAPLQEMNGTWTPYGCYENDQGELVVDHEAYRQAFQRVHDVILQELDSDLVQISWAPNNESTAGCGELADYYPGDEYVDVVGLSAFNFGTAPLNSSWRSPSDLVLPALSNVTVFAPDKPVVLAQTGSSAQGGDKAEWIADLFDLAEAESSLVSLIWFDLDKFEVGTDMDWTIRPVDESGWQRSTAVAYVFPMAWEGSGFVELAKAPLTLAGRLAGILIEAEPDCGAEWTHDTEPVIFEVATRNELRSVGFAIPPLPTDQLGLIDPEKGRWLLRRKTGEVVEFFFGGQGDIPLVGDWDCDGFDTPGVFRPSDASVHLTDDLAVGPAKHNFYLGLPGDVPLAGDFDNDGCDTVSIYRPGTGEVFVVDELGEGTDPVRVSTAYYFGDPGDVPFVGDFNGDGAETIGLYRPSSGYVYVRDQHLTGLADNEFYFGDPGDRLVAGNWTDGPVDTVAVFRPDDRSFYLRYTNDQGFADEVLAFGESDWVPIAGVFEV